jgi:hypothetical protein
MITDEQLVEMRARCSRAYRGPWVQPNDTGWKVYHDIEGPEIGIVVLSATNAQDRNTQNERNTTFIAHARTDLPACLDYIDDLKRDTLFKYRVIARQQDEIDRLKEEVASLTGSGRSRSGHASA